VKLSLSRHDARIDWLDRGTVGRMRRIAAGLDPADAVVEVTIVNDAYIRDLNRDYRGKDRPTDVISFSYIDDIDSERAPGELERIAGEVYISFETIQTQAREQGIVPEHLFLRIGVHGFLHVLGYGHDTGPDFEKMEAEEKRLLLDYLSPAEVEELF
jgi:probable rRNA maturation factor